MVKVNTSPPCSLHFGISENVMPITQNYLPTPKNLPGLMRIAYVNRLLVGILRGIENLPSRMKNDSRPLEHMYRATAERFWTEIVGITAFNLSMFVGADFAAKYFNRILPPRRVKALSPQIVKQSQIFEQLGLSHHRVLTSLNESIEEAYCYKNRPRIHRAISHQASLNKVKNTLKAKLIDAKNPLSLEAFESLWGFISKTPSLVRFVRRFNHLATGAVLVGVVISPFVGGTAVQWINDRVFSPYIGKVFHRLYKKNKLEESNLGTLPLFPQETKKPLEKELPQLDFFSLSPSVLANSISSETPQNPFYWRMSHDNG